MATFKEFYAEFDDRMTDFGKSLGRLVLALDDKTTQFGKVLGYKALKLKRKYRMRKAAIEDLKRRAAEMRKNVANNSFARSFVFETSIYSIVIAMLLFILNIPTTSSREIPRISYHVNPTPIIADVYTEDFSVDSNDNSEEIVDEEKTEFQFETNSSVDETVESEDSVNEDESKIEERNVPEEPEESEEQVGNTSYTWTEDDLTTLVLAVQHETGINPNYFPGEDFDLLQRCMARSIWNRVGTAGFGSDLSSVLNQNNQYTGLLYDIQNYGYLENSNQFDPYDERTRNNVLAVLEGYDGLNTEMYFERCSSYETNIDEAWANYTMYYNSDLYLCYWFNTSDGRFIMFGGSSNGAY